MIKKGFKVALFDGDGTLFDSMPTIHASVNSAFEKVLNKPLALEVLHQYGGHTLPDTLLFCAGGKDNCDDKTLDALIDAYVEYDKVNQQLILPYENVITTLNKLREAGIKTGIVTSRGRDSLINILANNKMSELFDTLVTIHDITEPKPHPQSVLMGLENLTHAELESVVMIGDTEKDILAGKAAGVATVAVLYGHASEEKLRSYNPDWCVNNFAEVEAIILNK